VVALANDDQHQTTEHGADTKDVSNKQPRCPGTEQRPVKLRIERLAVGLEPGQAADQKAPHDEPVRRSHGALLHHLGVRRELDDQLTHPRDELAVAGRVRLAQADDLHHPHHAADEEVPAHQTDQGTDGPQRDRQPVHQVRTPSWCSGPVGREALGDGRIIIVAGRGVAGAAADCSACW